MEREDVPTITDDDDDDDLLGAFEDDETEDDLERLENEGGEVEIGTGENGRI